MSSALAPTLDDLRRDLDRAQRELVCAEMIDNWPRCQREAARCRVRVSEVKAQIARIEEAF